MSADGKPAANDCDLNGVSPAIGREAIGVPQTPGGPTLRKLIS